MFRIAAPSARRRASRGRTLLAALHAALFAAGCGKDNTVAPGPERPYLGMVANPVDAYVNDADLEPRRRLRRCARRAWTSCSRATCGRRSSPCRACRAAVPRFQAKVFAAFGRQYYNLRIVDTNQRGTPSDLNATAWDAPEMFTRADAVDSLMGGATCSSPSASATRWTYFGAHPGELPAFRALAAPREIARAHASRPGIPVGCCTTSPVRNANVGGDTLNAYTDVRVYTYLPVPAAKDFTRRRRRREPTSTRCAITARRRCCCRRSNCRPPRAATADAQASRVRRFRQWLRRSPARVLGANWFLYTDWSGDTLNTLFAYYGLVSPGFPAGYLRPARQQRRREARMGGVAECRRAASAKDYDTVRDSAVIAHPVDPGAARQAEWPGARTGALLRA